ncbi:MAG: pantetheine-phosphate adenylyltransferase [Burkholderiaceae bacterium]|nr:pantetheine-phosphate adenylyltransferase [Burkholderiaceae bacterium]
MIAVYPGTFDPITNGHMDIIRRAAKIFPRLYVAVADSKRKNTLFSLEERIEFARKTTSDLPNVSVYGFSGLLVDFMQQHNALILVRGARAVSDFDYEFQMAGMNRKLMPQVETVFLVPADQYQFISATFVREIALLGGDVSQLVSEDVAKALEQKHLSFAETNH